MITILPLFLMQSFRRDSLHTRAFLWSLPSWEVRIIHACCQKPYSVFSFLGIGVLDRGIFCHLEFLGVKLVNVPRTKVCRYTLDFPIPHDFCGRGANKQKIDQAGHENCSQRDQNLPSIDPCEGALNTRSCAKNKFRSRVCYSEDYWQSCLNREVDWKELLLKLTELSSGKRYITKWTANKGL
jgi:hypothetical protein